MNKNIKSWRGKKKPRKRKKDVPVCMTFKQETKEENNKKKMNMVTRGTTVVRKGAREMWEVGVRE